MSSWHLFIIRFKTQMLKKNFSKDDVFNIFNAKKIFPQYHYIPIYKFRVFKGKEKRLPETENFYKSSLSLPIYYEMNFKDCDKVIKCVEISLRKFK